VSTTSPAWSKKVWWFIGVPAWIIFALLIVSGKSFELQWLSFIFFAAFAVPAAIQCFYIWRGRING
jgi:uncharacterized membrane protein YjdF